MIKNKTACSPARREFESWPDSRPSSQYCNVLYEKTNKKYFLKIYLKKEEKKKEKNDEKTGDQKSSWTVPLNGISIFYVTFQECGMFSAGFNDDVDRFVKILVNLPPMDGTR